MGFFLRSNQRTTRWRFHCLPLISAWSRECSCVFDLSCFLSSGKISFASCYHTTAKIHEVNSEVNEILTSNCQRWCCVIILSFEFKGPELVVQVSDCQNWETEKLFLFICCKDIYFSITNIDTCSLFTYSTWHLSDSSHLAHWHISAAPSSWLWDHYRALRQIKTTKQHINITVSLCILWWLACFLDLKG